MRTIEIYGFMFMSCYKSAQKTLIRIENKNNKYNFKRMPFKESKHQWSMWEYEKQSEPQLNGQEEEL